MDSSNYQESMGRSVTDEQSPYSYSSLFFRSDDVAPWKL